MQTLSDAINKLNAIPDLPRDRRRDLISAIQRVSDYLGRPISVIPTEPLKLRPLLEGIHHVQIGVSAKTLMNVKANLARALREVGMLPNKEVSTEQTNAWQAFMLVSTSKFHTVALSRFITYCSVRDIEPQSVNLSVLDAFEAHVSATSLTVNLTRERKQVVMTWNIMARLHNGKFASLPIGKRQNYRPAGLHTYPASLQEEIQTYIDRLSHADIFDAKGPPKPLRPVSLRNVQAHLRQYLAALHESGIPCDTMTSFKEVISREHMATAGRVIAARHGKNSIPIGVYNIFSTLLAIARYHLELPAADIVSLQKLKSKAARETAGMTTKNRTRLGQFTDINNVVLLVDLPSKLMSMAKAAPNNSTSAIRALHAVAIEILLCCPMRIGNVASLDIEKHITSHGTWRDRTFTIRIVADEVKNNHHIECIIKGRSAKLLQIYLDQFHAKLTTGSSTALFPERGSGMARSAANFSQTLSEEIYRYTGLEVNAHLFRHFAAYLYLKNTPGDFETVRRLLAHKKLQTTMDFYTSLSATWAHEHYDTNVLEQYRMQND